MTFNELANMVRDLFEAIAEYSRDATNDDKWHQVIYQCIQIDNKIDESYPQESENENDRTIQ
jgi:hypothetical protein